MTSPTIAPDYQLVRTVSTADDPSAALTLNQNNGINFGGYQYANLIIVPDAADTPTVALWVGLASGGFCRQLPAVSQAGSGNGVPFAVTWEVRGRLVLPYITGVTGACAVYANGFNVEGTR